MNIVNELNGLLQSGNFGEMKIAIDELISTGADDELLLSGELLVEYGFLDEAEKVYKQLLKIYPDEAELLITIAEILADKGEEDEAILMLEKISNKDEMYPQALLLLADLYEMEGLFEVSEQKLLDAKQILPNERIIDLALAQFYVNQGKFSQSLSFFNKVKDDEQLTKEVNINESIAELLSATGQFEEALQYYEKALEFQLEINTLFKYGLTALQAGHYTTAINKLTELKNIDYEYHSLYLLLAEAYEKADSLEMCLATIEEGLKIDEFNKELYFYGGKISLQLSNVEKAEQFFRQAIALDPNFTEAVISLNKLLLKEERYDEVISLLDELQNYNEDDPQYYWDRAYSYEQLEQYEKAFIEYEKAYKFFKEDELFLNDYGYFLIEEGKLVEAAEVFNKLLIKDPSNEQYIEVSERLNDL